MMDSVSNKCLILQIKRFFEEHTDEEEGAMIGDIQRYLKPLGFEPDKKTIDECIQALNKDGMEIQYDENGRKRKLLERNFDLAEVKMLIDCVASAKFLPEENSKKIIKHLGELVSIRQRRMLTKRVKVLDQFRGTNKSVLYNIDAIQTAIDKHVNIAFKYYHYNMNKEYELMENGKIYQIQPHKLLYDDNLYYVITSDFGGIIGYRVDRMTDIQEIEIKDRPVRRFDFESYREKYSKIEKIQMLFKKDMMDDVIDKFGKDVNTEIVDDGHFRVKIELIPDFQFYSWVFGLGDNVMIEYPLAVAAQMMDLLQERYRAYKEGHSRNIYYYRHKDKKASQLKATESTSDEQENDE